jgi:multidrug efflux pump subunit AcrA (membrane-fusion protein)
MVIAFTLGVGTVLAGWWDWLKPAPGAEEKEHGDSTRVKLSPAALENLKITTRRLNRDEYWSYVQIPGAVIDRPGMSDCGVTATVAGVVSKVHAFPGDIVRAGQQIVSIRPSSEHVHNSQMELLKNAKEFQINEEQLVRMRQLAATGGVPVVKVTELENQGRRLNALILSYRQDLLAKGLTSEQLARVEAGEFVKEITLVAPSARHHHPPIANTPETEMSNGHEVQELKVHLGDHVQPGEVVATLADHQWLLIEGRSFKKDAEHLERATKHGWTVTVEFPDDEPQLWPEQKQDFRIRHLANSVDVASRTFSFYLPLTNQSRTHEVDGRKVLIWRYRPGQRARLHVPVERYQDVFVLPATAIVREAGETYIFRQNGKVFERMPVRVVHEDRRHVVLADDGAVRPGLVVIERGAAALNRVLQTQQSGGGGHDHHHHH